MWPIMLSRSGRLTGSMVEALVREASRPRCARGTIRDHRRGEGRAVGSGRVHRASRTVGEPDEGRGGPDSPDRSPSSEGRIALTWTISAMRGVSADWPRPHGSSRPNTSTGTAIPRARRANSTTAHPTHDRTSSPLLSLTVNSRPSGSCLRGPHKTARPLQSVVENPIPTDYHCGNGGSVKW